ncbi:replication/maintenance protein RepL [Clostridium perfringens]|uniref:replication/maintenance protein RepL n=1 Tax=Clostridium perfringens TaxID=1502 RepID=UPI0039E9F462
MDTKKIVDSIVERTIRHDSKGNVTLDETTMQNKIRLVDKEPTYMKLYLDDISLLKQLSKMENLILHEIFKITQYNTNRVILNKFYRDSISESLGIKDQTVRNAISKLRKLDFLIKEGVGVYILNPNYFGIGDWSVLKGLRLVIEYTKEGRKIEIKEIKE